MQYFSFFLSGSSMHDLTKQDLKRSGKTPLTWKINSLKIYCRSVSLPIHNSQSTYLTVCLSRHIFLLFTQSPKPPSQKPLAKIKDNCAGPKMTPNKITEFYARHYWMQKVIPKLEKVLPFNLPFQVTLILAPIIKKKTSRLRNYFLFSVRAFQLTLPTLTNFVCLCF